MDNVQRTVSTQVLPLAWFLMAAFLSLALLCAVFGAPFSYSMKYFIYTVVYIIVPGSVAYGLSRSRAEHWFGFLVKSWIVGNAVEMTAGLLAVMTGMKAYYPLLGLLYAGMAVAFRHRIGAVGLTSPTTSPNYTATDIAAFAALSGGLISAAALYNFDTVIDQHFTWIAAFAGATVNHWPVPEPFLMDVPLNYHYLYNIHVGMASYVTGVPLIIVSARLSLATHALLFLAMLFVFCRNRFDYRWVGLIAAAQLLMTFGYSKIYGAVLP
jgi:hypothetical protein